MNDNRVISTIRRVVELVCVIALFAIMIYTVANVLARILVGPPLPAAIELITRWWMIPLVFGAWLLAYVAKEHIHVDFVVEGTRSGIRFAYELINRLLLLLFLGLIIYGGWVGATENRIRGEYGIDTGWPVWTTRYFVPILVALLFGYIAFEFYHMLKRRFMRSNGDDAQGAKNERSMGNVRN